MEGIACASVIQLGFAVEADPAPGGRFLGFLEVFHDAGLGDTVEHRSGDFESEGLGCHTQVRFQHLSDVHPGRHAEWVQHDVNRGSVFEEWHVFFWHDLGHNALVTVTSGHLVTHGEFPLGSNEDLNFLDDAGFDFVARFHLVQVHFPLVVEFGKLRFKGTGNIEDLVPHWARIDLDVIVFLGHLVQERLGDLLIGRDDDFARLRIDHVQRDFLVEQVLAEFLRQGVDEFIALGLVFFFDLLELLALFRLGNALFVGILAAGHADVHHDPHTAGWHAEGSVFHVSGFLTEDGAQEAFFRSQFRLGLRSDLAHENIARTDFRPDAHHAVCTQILERFFTHVRNIPRDFFRSQLGVTSADFEFLDVNGGVDVFLHDLGGDGDSIFEIITIPRHERHQDVAAQGQFAIVCARTVCQDLTFLHLVATTDDWALVDAGAGIAAHKFAERINEDFLTRIVLHAERIPEEFAVSARQFPVLGHDDHFRSGSSNDTLGLGNGDRFGIASRFPFDASAHQRSFRLQQRHTLTLHVRSHQGSVRIIVFEERNHGGGHGNNLLRTHVHVGHVLGLHFQELTTVTHCEAFVGEMSVLANRIVRLGDVMVFFLVSGQVVDLLGDYAVDDLAVRRLDEPELVDASEGGHGVDQTDVWTFRSLNRANPAIVGRMHVTNFKARTVTIQTAWPEGGQTTFVGQFRERIDLIHELGELAAAEEVTHHGTEGLGVDEFLRGHAFHVHIEQGHALFHQTLRAAQAHAALVGEEFTHGPHTTAAQVIDIIQDAFAFTEAEQITQRSEEIFVCQNPHVLIHLQAQLLIQLVTAHAGEIIFLGIEEETLQQGLGVRDRWWIPRAQALVDVLQGFFFILGRIFLQALDERVIRRHFNDLDALVTQVDELLDHGWGDRLVGLGNNIFSVEDVCEDHLGPQGFFVRQSGLQLDVLNFVELLDDVCIGWETDTTQERGDQELPTTTAAVEVNVEQVIGVELHFQPRSAVRNDAETMQHLAVQVLVFFKRNTRGTVQLGNDDPLSAIDGEGATLGHQGQFAHVNALFLGAGFVTQCEGHVERSAEGFPFALGFIGGQFGFTHFIMAEVQHGLLIVTVDGEDFLENGLQADHDPLGRRHILLEELLVGIDLHLDEIRWLDDFR